MSLRKVLHLIIITSFLFACGSENSKRNSALKLIDIHYNKLNLVFNDNGAKLNNKCNCLKFYLINELQKKHTARELIILKKNSVPAVAELMGLFSKHSDEIGECLEKMSSEKEVNYELFERRFSKTLASVNPGNDSHEQKEDVGKTIIKMNKKNGVYEIPAEINGLTMFFIFDTGASIISISETEANYLLKQGRLDKLDIIGNQKFVDANGDISDGTIINLKTVKIGEVLLKNIKASVVHNQEAPLLFGQSALEQFGKISIDYKKGEIAFE